MGNQSKLVRARAPTPGGEPIEEQGRKARLIEHEGRLSERGGSPSRCRFC
jgi:hypothetical protein